MPPRESGPVRRKRQTSQRSGTFESTDTTTPPPYDYYLGTFEQTPEEAAAEVEERLTAKRLSTKASVNKARERVREGKLLTYPLDMKSNATDYLEIRVINYKRNGFLNSPGSRQTSEETTGFVRVKDSEGNLIPSEESATRLKELLRVIQLPIPSNVQDGNSVSYESSNLNGIVGGLAGFTQDLLGLSGKDLKDLGASLEKIIAERSTGLSADVANDLVNKLLVSQAVGVFGGNVTVNQLLAREQGAIFNPNMELLFNGPTLRQFRFSFKMTPRDEKESIQVKKIIREFKQSMAPKVVDQGGNSNLFLRTPNVFELRYRQGTAKHPFLHRFKQCALTDMSVNYTGEGTYATYSDATPVSMIMDLTFKELEPVYDIDYNDGIGGVGY
jgi:hypothetical protein